ncbi:MAG: hypothetical protein WC247_12645 [Porticoccaceae bacterium]
MPRLANKVAIVAGGATGIGAACASRYAAAPWPLFSPATSPATSPASACDGGHFVHQPQMADVRRAVAGIR